MVGLDIQDEMGRHEVGHIENSMKVPLNDGYGCRFEGEFSINKVRNGPRAPGSIMSPKVLLKYSLTTFYFERNKKTFFFIFKELWQNLCLLSPYKNDKMKETPLFRCTT